MEQNNAIRYGNLVEFYAMKTRNMHIPFSGTFELTPKCNMNCKMCYIRMSEKEMENVGGELPLDLWIKIAKEAVDKGMIMLLLTGGEAILYKDFKPLYLELRKMGLFISINTNGTVLNKSWIDFFKKYPPAKFNITIYGGSNETYANLCGNPKGFDQLKRTIEELQKNNFEILLNCTITKQNVHDMGNIYRFAREHKLNVHTTTYNFPPVRKEGVDNPELNRLTPYEAAKARIYVNYYSIYNKEKLLNFINNILNKLNRDEKPETCNEGEGEKVWCAAGRSNFWVTWDGRMLPCGMIPDFAVPMKEYGFEDAWEKVVNNTSGIRLTPKCAKCNKKDLCAPCAAKITAETGSYDNIPSYLCEYANEYIRLLKLAKEYLENG